MRKKCRAALITSLVSCSVTSFVHAQTTHDVTLSGFDFTPADITVQLGDTVHWVWVGGSHNVVSGVGGVPDGNFDSGAVVSGATFDVVFDQSLIDSNPMPNNEYPYYCEPHRLLGMVGTVTVEIPAGEPAPALSIPGVLLVACMLIGVAVTILARHDGKLST